MAYASVPALKTFMRDDSDPVVAEDAIYEVAIQAASAAIDRACNQAAGGFGDYNADPDAVPASINLATLIQAARFVKRRDAPFGVAGSPDMGNELRLLARLDPDVLVLVANHRNWWSAA